MFTDTYGQVVYEENDLIDLYLTNPSFTANHLTVNKKITFPEQLELENVPKLVEYVTSNLTIEDFDKNMQSHWFLPDKYKNFDIAQFVLDQCQNEEELQRAGKELLLYQERDMFMLLKYLKYLVDTMRQNNIVWGVGRGSSVSSFVLFILGVHKINSIYYELDIEEFLK